MTILFLFVALFALMFIGVPVAVSLGLAGSLTIMIFSQDSVRSLAIKLFETSEHYTLLAIPFFLLSGAFMTTGGVAKRLIDFANACVGHIRGGLAIGAVLACMLFAALSGSSPATVAAVGSIAIAGMVRSGYPQAFGAGIVCNAGTLGILIPPSVVMVVYAAATETSVGKLFMAGVVPGIMLGLALMVALMVSGLVPNVLAALIGCLVMGLFRCIDMDSAYKAIHWQSLVLIVGMLPFALALQKTGGIALATSGLVGLLGDAGPHALLACLFLLTALIGLFISNTATAVLMAPVALATAEQLGASPYPFAMIVALAASAAFMTPISSPVNTLVLGPGQYRFGDFVRIGVPFTVLVMIVAVLLVPLVFPL